LDGVAGELAAAGPEAGRAEEAVAVERVLARPVAPGILAMPMAPTGQAADATDPVLASPGAVHRDAAWISVTEPGWAEPGAAAEWPGLTTVTRSRACVVVPPGAMAMYRPAPASNGTADSAAQYRGRPYQGR
jgi:hypothetical protein